MRIPIIDLDSVAFYMGYPNKVLDEKGEPIKEDGKFLLVDKTEDELKNSCNYWMNKILKDCSATSYIAYIKGRNTIVARKEVAETYKSNRTKEQPKWWSFVKQYLIEEYNAVEVNDMEVDDAVNITRLNVPDSFICALDKDLLYLEGTHYNWSKEEWITTTKNDAKYYFWHDMIAGQSGDGVKGIPKKGTKYVEKLFQQKGEYLEKLNQYYYTNTLHEYITHFGEAIGIEQFYKNYKCLRILDEYEGFIIPNPVDLKNSVDV